MELHVFVREHNGRHECARIQGGPSYVYVPSWVGMNTTHCEPFLSENKI